MGPKEQQFTSRRGQGLQLAGGGLEIRPLHAPRGEGLGVVVHEGTSPQLDLGANEFDYRQQIKSPPNTIRNVQWKTKASFGQLKSIQLSLIRNVTLKIMKSIVWVYLHAFPIYAQQR